MVGTRQWKALGIYTEWINEETKEKWLQWIKLW